MRAITKGASYRKLRGIALKLGIKFPLRGIRLQWETQIYQSPWAGRGLVKWRLNVFFVDKYPFEAIFPPERVQESLLKPETKLTPWPGVSSPKRAARQHPLGMPGRMPNDVSTPFLTFSDASLFAGPETKCICNNDTRPQAKGQYRIPL